MGSKFRWMISIMGIYSSALMFAHRAAMSIAIVRMTKTNSLPMVNGSIIENIDLIINNNAPQFDWSQTIQGIVLGSSFYLYWCVPSIAGYFTDRFGGKWFALCGVLGPGILIALIPFVAQWGLGLLILTQTLIGTFQGLTYPALFSLYIQWFPADERSIANSGMQVGASIGMTIMFSLSGLLCETSIGWPLIFYTLSAAHVPCILLWFYFGDNRPTDSRHISDSELKFILNFNNQNHSKKIKRIPWKSILTSVPVWCSIVCRSAGSFGFFLLLNKVPSYLSTNYGMNITKNGYFNAFITLAYGISSFSSPYLSNILINHRIFSLLITRKIFQFLAMGGTATCLFLMSLAQESETFAIVLLITSFFCYGGITGGEWTIISEFAPNLSGMLNGLVLLLPFIMGLLSPYIVGIVIDSNIDLSIHYKWSLVFNLTGGFLLIGVLGFLFFGTDRQQDWDRQAIGDENNDDDPNHLKHNKPEVF